MTGAYEPWMGTNGALGSYLSWEILKKKLRKEAKGGGQF